MVFMTYKPKAAKNVKAEQVTEKNIEEIAATFFGTAKVVKNSEEIMVLNIATLDGIVSAIESEWIVRSEDGIVVLSDEEFNEKYERARVVANN